MIKDTQLILDSIKQFRSEVNQRFSNVDLRFDQIENRLLLIEKELLATKSDINRLDNKIIGYSEMGRFDAVTRTELKYFADLNGLKYTNT